MQVAVFGQRGRGLPGKVWHLNFLAFFWPNSHPWNLKIDHIRYNIPPLCYKKPQFGCGKKKSPERGQKKSPNATPMTLPHHSMSTLIPVNNTHVRQHKMFCQTIQLNYYMADKLKENNKLLLCRSLKNLIHSEPAFVWQ